MCSFPIRFLSATVLAGALSFASALVADPFPYASAGVVYRQNFDTLPKVGKNPQPWLDGETLPGWHVWFGANRDGAGSGPGAPLTIAVSDGSASSTRLYSLGAPSSTERALGANPGATSGHTVVALALRNTTGTTLRQVSVSYTLEQWRAGVAAPRSLTADFRLGGNAAFGLLTHDWSPLEALSFSNPVTSSTPVALDGNAPAHRTPLRAELTGLNWSPGAVLWIRFVNLHESGGNHLFALDDFELSAR